jgi:hypothetical protein
VNQPNWRRFSQIAFTVEAAAELEGREVEQ